MKEVNLKKPHIDDSNYMIFGKGKTMQTVKRSVVGCQGFWGKESRRDESVECRGFLGQ